MPNADENIKITCLILTYNEEKRIEQVLKHATQWADEVVVIDKSSTDHTVEICHKFSSKIKVNSIPYSAQGHEDTKSFPAFASHSWIYLNTCSEIPTRTLINEIHKLLKITAGELDLVYVPRRMFSFGMNNPKSPWYVSYYPFLFNKNKTIISNKIHENFSPSTATNTATIPFSDNCCVFHLTHPTATQYMNSMTQYFSAEANKCMDPELKLRDCFQQIQEQSENIFKSGDDWVGIYCAWNIYWLGTALFIWEKQRNLDINQYYNELSAKLIESEWSDHPKTTLNFSNLNLQNKSVLNTSQFNYEMRTFLRPGLIVRLKIKLKRIKSLVHLWKLIKKIIKN